MTAPAHKLVEFVCKGMMFRGEVRCVCACGFSTDWAPDAQQAAKLYEKHEENPDADRAVNRKEERLTK